VGVHPGRLAVQSGIDDYRQAIAQIKQAIARGDTYQVNYTIALRAAWRGDPWGLFIDLAKPSEAATRPTLTLGDALSARPHRSCSWISPAIA
jgi:para-aminobenzoate synthetase / 4-amino-4-deoxychorismate lyase